MAPIVRWRTLNPRTVVTETTAARDRVAAKTIIVANLVAYAYLTARAGGQVGSGLTGGLDTGSSTVLRYTLFAPAVSQCGERYRILTSAFVHFSLWHVGFNMLVLWIVASVLERELGSLRFVAVYGLSVVAGSLGVLLASPLVNTGGASGGVFGVAGAATVLLMRRGSGFYNSGFGPLLVINLLFTFIEPNVSVGAHIGGLIGGVVAGLLLVRRDGTRAESPVAVATVVALTAATFVACLWAAGRAPDILSCQLLR
jgi:membrane associated rhomboid family serine protease